MKGPWALLVGIQIGAATMTNSMEVDEKINTPTLDPVIVLLSIYLENTKTLPQKEGCTPMFTAAFFTITRHGNTDLRSIMLSNSDTERQIPDALMYIPYGKNILKQGY